MSSALALNAADIKAIAVSETPAKLRYARSMM
ncbi:Uncharacterised protein [Vibrio cholerae]|nr:Uncharacterised protein [Vibrio cholerae]